MRRIIYTIVALIVLSVSAFAWDYETQTCDTTNSVQLRAGAEFTKKWNNGLRLGIAEELRFDVYNSASGAAFSKSYTTLSLAYAHPVFYT